MTILKKLISFGTEWLLGKNDKINVSNNNNSNIAVHGDVEITNNNTTVSDDLIAKDCGNYIEYSRSSTTGNAIEFKDLS